MTKGKPYKNF